MSIYRMATIAAILAALAGAAVIFLSDDANGFGLLFAGIVLAIAGRGSDSEA